MPRPSPRIAAYYLIGLIVGFLVLFIIYYVVPRYRRGFVAALIATIFFVAAIIALVIDHFYSAKQKIALLEKAESLGFGEETTSGLKRVYRNKEFYISPERRLEFGISALVKTRNVSGRRINFSGYNEQEQEKLLGKELVQKAKNLGVNLPELGPVWASTAVKAERLDKIIEVMDLIISVERVVGAKGVGELNV